MASVCRWPSIRPTDTKDRKEGKSENTTFETQTLAGVWSFLNLLRENVSTIIIKKLGNIHANKSYLEKT